MGLHIKSQRRSCRIAGKTSNLSLNVVESIHNVKCLSAIGCVCCRRDNKEERYSLTDQIRRSSRSVCANLAEAWRKRRYQAAFIAKLNDSEAEAAETQIWIKFAVKCNYLDVELGREIYATYNKILGSLVKMINNPSVWIIK